MCDSCDGLIETYEKQVEVLEEMIEIYKDQISKLDRLLAMEQLEVMYLKDSKKEVTERYQMLLSEVEEKGDGNKDMEV